MSYTFYRAPFGDVFSSGGRVVNLQFFKNFGEMISAKMTRPSADFQNFRFRRHWVRGWRFVTGDWLFFKKLCSMMPPKNCLLRLLMPPKRTLSNVMMPCSTYFRAYDHFPTKLKWLLSQKKILQWQGRGSPCEKSTEQRILGAGRMIRQPSRSEDFLGQNKA